MKIFKEILSWALTILAAVAIALLIDIFLFQPHKVVGESMYPTLKNGQLGIMSKIDHTFGMSPNRGDIVIIDSRVTHVHSVVDDLSDSLKYNIIASVIWKTSNNNYWIKRVIGVGGDTIEVKKGRVFRNGKPVRENYIYEPMDTENNFAKITVPKGHFFVMGDNRNNSTDSRVIGTVPLSNVIGKLAVTF